MQLNLISRWTLFCTTCSLSELAVLLGMCLKAGVTNNTCMPMYMYMYYISSIAHCYLYAHVHVYMHCTCTSWDLHILWMTEMCSTFTVCWLRGYWTWRAALHQWEPTWSRETSMQQTCWTLPMELMTSWEGMYSTHGRHHFVGVTLSCTSWSTVHVDESVHFRVCSGCSVKENLHHMMRSDKDFAEDSYKEVRTCIYMWCIQYSQCQPSTM